MFRQFAKERQARAKVLANNAQLYHLSVDELHCMVHSAGHSNELCPQRVWMHKATLDKGVRMGVALWQLARAHKPQTKSKNNSNSEGDCQGHQD